jgi:hypothetical protein
MLCRACSESSPDDGSHHHDHGDDGGGWSPERNVGISADPDRARELLDEWAAAGAGRSWTDLDVVLH